MFDPSANAVGSVFVDDTLGDPTPVSAVFPAPIALSAPGTYTLEIFADEAPETGNHIGIDDLSINGEVSGMPETFQLIITPNAANPDHYDFRWESMDGKLYDLVSSTDLSTAPAGWPVWQGNSDIEGTSPENTLADIPGGGPMRFFAMIEKNRPPLFSADFEATDGGFTALVTGGTSWAYGSPNSPSLGGGAVTAGNGGSAKCWGTNIGSPGGYLAGTDTSLRSPVIDLTGVSGAILSFAQALDIAPGHALFAFRL